MSKFHKRHVNQIWWNVITWHIKNIIWQLSRRLQSLNLVGIHMQIKWYRSYFFTIFIITCFLYFYMSFLYFRWSCNLSKLHSATSKKTIGVNTHKNEMVAYLHMKWPNHGKLIQATAPKVALMKGTNINRLRDFDILTNEKSISNFYKGC